MARIFHHIANYDATYAAKNTAQETSAECSRLDLCRCLMTVGNPSYFSWAAIRQHGFARALYDSILSKYALVMQNLRVTNETICRHPIFEGYVSDQKRIISYNLGMAFAKFYAESVFGIADLVHIEFLKKQDAVVLTRNDDGRRSREPDLVGSDVNGQWHLFEAKGVSGNEGQLGGKILDAKEQLAKVSSIHAVSPETRSACATYIGLDRILSRIEDPEGDSEKSIEISRDSYFDAYYKPFSMAEADVTAELGLQMRDLRIDGIDVVGFELERGSTKLLFGLEAELRAFVLERNFPSLSSVRQKLDDLSRRKDEKYSVGLDGYVVQNLGLQG